MWAPPSIEGWTWEQVLHLIVSGGRLACPYRCVVCLEPFGRPSRPQRKTCGDRCRKRLQRPQSEMKLKTGGKVHVEHIIPKKDREDEYWAAQIDAPDEYEEVVARWGNLTLLLGTHNSAISNGTWDTKRNGTQKYSGYAKSEVALTKDLAELPEWRSGDVDLRARWLATVAVRVWNQKQTSPLGLPDSYSEVRANPSLLKPLQP